MLVVLLSAIFAVMLILTIGVLIMAVDLTAFNATLGKLSADVDTLVARQPNLQPTVDAATAALVEVDNKIVAATPAA
jgi:outer membrane murein-binding lipoprotein Lpp